MTNLPNNTLLQGGKYRIIRFIKSGGFGCTYEAEHAALGKRVAIKEFFVKDFCNRDETTTHITVATKSKVALVKKLKKKFIDEAKALSNLSHHGIVKVSDFFEENNTAYFVMDYIDGPSLNDLVERKGALSEARALRYIGQVCEALEYVHAHNRLHLDIKPGNIMIDSHDNAVLIDFGASKQYDEENGENTSTLVGRTPGYAPLEQMGNDVTKFYPATDIYAIGATLYMLITGKRPISASTRINGEELAPLPAGTAYNTQKAIGAAMELRTKDRPQTMKEFIDILMGKTAKSTVQTDNDITILTPQPKPRKIAETIHVEAKPSQPAVSPVPQHPKNNNYTLAIVAGTIIAALIIGLIYWFTTISDKSGTAIVEDEEALPVAIEEPTEELEAAAEAPETEELKEQTNTEDRIAQSPSVASQSGNLRYHYYSGYFSDNEGEHPVMLCFIRNAEGKYEEAIYKNMTYGGKIHMKASLFNSYIFLHGFDGSQDFTIRLHPYGDNHWEGHANVGKKKLTTTIYPSSETFDWKGKL